LNTQVYFRYTSISTNFTFEFIRRPISPILSPSSRTFVELTLVTAKHTETQKHEIGAWEIKDWRRKLRRGAADVISISSDDSTYVTMMKRE
jgi:hypothetical protein